MRRSTQGREVADLSFPVSFPVSFQAAFDDGQKLVDGLCRKESGSPERPRHPLSRAEALVSVTSNGGDILSQQYPAGLSCPLKHRWGRRPTSALRPEFRQGVLPQSTVGEYPSTLSWKITCSLIWSQQPLMPEGPNYTTYLSYSGVANGTHEANNEA